MQRGVAALTMMSKQIEVSEDDEDERNKSLPTCRCVLTCSVLYYIFSFIHHLGSNTIITVKEIKVLVYEIISNSITK